MSNMLQQIFYLTQRARVKQNCYLRCYGTYSIRYCVLFSHPTAKYKIFVRFYEQIKYGQIELASIRHILHDIYVTVWNWLFPHSLLSNDLRFEFLLPKNERKSSKRVENEKKRYMGLFPECKIHTRTSAKRCMDLPSIYSHVSCCYCCFCSCHH